jgi:hypothetical protein
MSSLSERGKCSCAPYLKGRGTFIVGRRLDNYKLFISISTKRFTCPVGLDLRRSVCRGRLEDSTVFEPILETSRLPPTIPWVLHDSGVDGARISFWGDWLARSLHGDDIFPHGVMRWMG